MFFLSIHFKDPILDLSFSKLQSESWLSFLTDEQEKFFLSVFFIIYSLTEADYKSESNKTLIKIVTKYYFAEFPVYT